MSQANSHHAVNAPGQKGPWTFLGRNCPGQRKKPASERLWSAALIELGYGMISNAVCKRKKFMPAFISEDDLDTFEGWLRYQAVDLTTATADERAFWRTAFDESRERASTTPKVGLMKLRMVPGEYRYAVAVREGADLRLTLWVRRSPKGEFFVFLPSSDRSWNPHASYHLDGTFHSKTFNDTKMGPPQKRQPLTGTFRGTENLGSYLGHAPKAVGAICDPAAFSGIVEVPPGVLGPRHGMVVVDLIEPGCEPLAWSFAHTPRQEVFRDFEPWLVIRIGS